MSMPTSAHPDESNHAIESASEYSVPDPDTVLTVGLALESE